MKLLHLGDLHIGKSLGDYDLYEDQAYILERVLEMVREDSVDAVVIAGDVYDKAIPSEAAVKLLDFFVSKLAEEEVGVFLISGNHDSDERLNFGSRLFEVNGIHIVSKFDGTLRKYTLEDDFGTVNFYLLPFVKASQVRHFYPEEEISSYDDAVRTVLEHSDFDPGERNVLVAHQFVCGKEDPGLAGSEGASAQNVGLVEKISYGSMEQFDYVALGHIHSPQQVGREHIRYSGSPLKYSLAEAHSDKSVPIVTLEAKGEVRIELKPLKPLRNLRHIKGRMKELLAKENIVSPEDFIYVTLTDEEFVNDAMGIFQQYYPNVVKIDYDNTHTRELERVDISDIAENKSFEELISDFYQLMYGCGMGEDELEMMRLVAREAGVVHETD